MKIKIEIDEGIAEEEVIVRCKELNEATILLQQKIAEAIHSKMQLQVIKQEKEYFLNLEEIIFMEAVGNVVTVHTADQIYEKKQRLYELEETLPGNFMRVAKSTIINTSRIRSINKNITGASEVEFLETSKKAYASRTYIKALFEKMQEKRLGK